MQFLAPSAYLGFFALAAIPVVLYLLFRWRKRDVPWAATYILKRVLESKSKQNIWKQYIIVFLRTLALAALVFSFLEAHLPWRPPAGGEFPRPAPSTHRVVLLDLSGSMSATYRGGTGRDAALSLCRKVLGSSTFPSRVDILPLDGRGEALTCDKFPATDRAIEKLIAELQISSKPADLETGLRSVARIFRASAAGGKELYVLSDFSRRDLADHQACAGLMRSLEKMAVRPFCLQYRTDERSNFALLDMSAGLDLLLAGQPTLFYVTIGYYGSQDTADTWLTIRNQTGEVLHEDTVSLAQGEKTLEIPLTLTGGEQTLIASLNDDDLSLDNVLKRSFRVSQELKLTVVQNINLAKGLSNPREWLKLAMGEGQRPRLARHVWYYKKEYYGSDGKRRADAPAAEDAKRCRIIMDYAIPSQIDALAADERDGVILLDVDAVPDEALEALQDYVIKGGTVFLAPGPVADPEKFNKAFAPIAPAALSNPARGAIDPQVHYSCVIESAENPILRELEAPQHGNIGNARFYNYYAVEPETVTEGASVLLSLSNGAPLLLKRRIGRGCCLLWTAGLGMDWHSMVVHAAYPVFFSRLLNLAAATRRFALNLKPGDPIIREVETNRAGMILPTGEKRELKALVVGKKRYIRFDETHGPGSYALLPDPQDETCQWRYHVREERHESDYRPLEGDELARFEKLVGAQLLRNEEELIRLVGSSYLGRGLTVYAALAALFCLLAEAGFARLAFPPTVARKPEHGR